MSATSILAWFNGALIEAATLSLDPADRGLLLGDGAFETVAVFGGTAFRLREHMDRLMGTSEALGLGLARDKVEAATSALLHCHAGRAGILRLTATRGPAPRGLAAEGKPSLLATLAPWPSFAALEPVRLITADTRRNDQSPASRLKTLSYLDNIFAAREAAARGADDAVMLNTRGRVACSTIANLFMVRDGMLVTPPVGEGVLPGITRKLVLEAFDVAERPIAPEELGGAGEAFLTNSLRLVRPVAAIDGVALADIGYPMARACLDHLHRLIAAECGALPPAVRSDDPRAEAMTVT